jgi:hypothetical protein
MKVLVRQKTGVLALPYYRFRLNVTQLDGDDVTNVFNSGDERG